MLNLILSYNPFLAFQSCRTPSNCNYTFLYLSIMSALYYMLIYSYLRLFKTLLHVFFQDFPISLISKVVDADKELSDALAEAAPQAITARYDLGYDTDYEQIKWAFTPNVMSLYLVYGGADHHIRIEFNSNYNYICAADELTQPNSFLSLAKSGVALQLKAIYDGSNLIQRFGAEEGNYMHIIFKASPS